MDVQDARAPIRTKDRDVSDDMEREAELKKALEKLADIYTDAANHPEKYHQIQLDAMVVFGRYLKPKQNEKKDGGDEEESLRR